MREDKMKAWNEVKRFYREKFGTEPSLVDVAADFDILKLCATGSSNESIAKFFGYKVDDVSHLIHHYMGWFGGWQYDLWFSPLVCYKSLDAKDGQVFKQKVIREQGLATLSESLIDVMFRLSEMVCKFEKVLDEKWI